MWNLTKGCVNAFIPNKKTPSKRGFKYLLFKGCEAGNIHSCD